MSIECSTNSSTLPKPVEASRDPRTASSESSARPDAKQQPPTRPLPRHRADTQTFWFWLMAGPAMLGFVLFSLGPMLASALLSLTRYDVLTPPKFIGFDNYFYLMREDPAFWPSVKVTLIYAAVSVPLSLAISLGVALLLNRRVKLLGTFRTIYSLPSLLPATASGVVWVCIFHPTQGLLNRLLGNAGIAKEHLPAWTQSVDWALPALI